MPFAVAAALTWIAGFVDAVGFISLGRIYTANMSGNSVAIGIQWASQNWMETIRRAWPVAAYVAGLLLCRILIEFGARERIRSIASIAFLLEIALLAPAFFANLQGVSSDSPVVFGYIALLGVAMGIQNGALTHFSSLTIHTGFVTGTLLKCAEEFTKYLTWAFDRVRRPGSSMGQALKGSFEQTPLRLASWLAFIWIAYVIGAVCGTWGDHTVKCKALAVPMAALLAIAALDVGHPLAGREEQEQAQLSS